MSSFVFFLSHCLCTANHPNFNSNSIRRICRIPIQFVKFFDRIWSRIEVMASSPLNKIERAHQMYRDGRYGEALGFYTEAIGMAKTKPQKIALHSNRAACYLKLHRFKKVWFLLLSFFLAIWKWIWLNFAMHPNSVMGLFQLLSDDASLGAGTTCLLLDCDGKNNFDWMSSSCARTCAS